jgi:hypothetical protein
MDTIDKDTLQQASYAVAAINTSETGPIHTVTITLNGQHGGADVIIQSELHDDLTLVLR